MKNSLMVWKLSLQIYSSPNKNGKSFPVGKSVSCNREMTGNAPSIRGLWIHSTRKVKRLQLGSQVKTNLWLQQLSSVLWIHSDPIMKLKLVEEVLTRTVTTQE